LPVIPAYLFDGPAIATATIALARGAGMGSPFMEFFSKGLGKCGIWVDGGQTGASVILHESARSVP
jgi:hypothetical protein